MLEATLYSPGWGAVDATITEFKKIEDCNPFAVDVYCKGNLIRQEFTEVMAFILFATVPSSPSSQGYKTGSGKRDFGFLNPLIDNNIDWKQRPTMEAMRRLTANKLEIVFPCHPTRCAFSPSFAGFPSHWKEQIKLAHQGSAPIPNLPERLASERQRRHLDIQAPKEGSLVLEVATFDLWIPLISLAFHCHTCGWVYLDFSVSWSGCLLS